MTTTNTELKWKCSYGEFNSLKLFKKKWKLSKPLTFRAYQYNTGEFAIAAALNGSVQHIIQSEAGPDQKTVGQQFLKNFEIYLLRKFNSISNELGKYFTDKQLKELKEIVESNTG